MLEYSISENSPTGTRPGQLDPLEILKTKSNPLIFLKTPYNTIP